MFSVYEVFLAVQETRICKSARKRINVYTCNVWGGRKAVCVCVCVCVCVLLTFLAGPFLFGVLTEEVMVS